MMWSKISIFLVLFFHCFVFEKFIWFFCIIPFAFNRIYWPETMNLSMFYYLSVLRDNYGRAKVLVWVIIELIGRIFIIRNSNLFIFLSEFVTVLEIMVLNRKIIESNGTKCEDTINEIRGDKELMKVASWSVSQSACC